VAYKITGWNSFNEKRK